MATGCYTRYLAWISRTTYSWQTFLLMSCVYSAWIGTETLIVDCVTFQYRLKSPGRWEKRITPIHKKFFVAIFCFASSLKCWLNKSGRSCRKKIHVTNFNVLTISFNISKWCKILFFHFRHYEDKNIMFCIRKEFTVLSFCLKWAKYFHSLQDAEQWNVYNF